MTCSGTYIFVIESHKNSTETEIILRVLQSFEELWEITNENNFTRLDEKYEFRKRKCLTYNLEMNRINTSPLLNTVP